MQAGHHMASNPKASRGLLTISMKLSLCTNHITSSSILLCPWLEQTRTQKHCARKISQVSLVELWWTSHILFKYKYEASLSSQASHISSHSADHSEQSPAYLSIQYLLLHFEADATYSIHPITHKSCCH